jgi:hypothetical protein
MGEAHRGADDDDDARGGPSPAVPVVQGGSSREGKIAATVFRGEEEVSRFQK